MLFFKKYGKIEKIKMIPAKIRKKNQIFRKFLVEMRISETLFTRYSCMITGLTNQHPSLSNNGLIAFVYLLHDCQTAPEGIECRYVEKRG